MKGIVFTEFLDMVDDTFGIEENRAATKVMLSDTI